MHIPALDQEIINSAFTVMVMIASCSAVYVASSAKRQIKLLGDHKLSGLEESLRKMIERAEDAGDRLSSQLRLEKNELNHLLLELKGAKQSPERTSSSSADLSRRLNTEIKDEFPNETWLEGDRRRTTRRYSTNGEEAEGKHLAALIAGERDDKINISAQSLEIVKKRFGKLGAVSSSQLEKSSNEIAYTIARRLLREGKAPEVVAKKLDLEIGEVYILANQLTASANENESMRHAAGR